MLLSGSLRAGSVNGAVLRTLAAQLPAGDCAALYGGLADLPPFNPDLDVEPLPAPVAELRAALAGADALLICTPEYTGALPGAFKNLLDWTVGGGEMDRKPAAWINASGPGAPRGGEDAHHSLRLVLGYLGARIVEDACLRLHVTRALIGPDGLIAGEEVGAALDGVVRALRAAVSVGEARRV